MLKLISDFMILEMEDNILNGLSLPDNYNPTQGDTFIVKDIGPGERRASDDAIQCPEVRIGDRVWLYGKMLSLPYNNEKVLIARAGDVIMYERDEKIPDKI